MQQPAGGDLLGQANPNLASAPTAFANAMNEAPAQFHSGGGSNGGIPLPDAKPGDNGLIGLLSSSIRKLFKDCEWRKQQRRLASTRRLSAGVADALSQSLPNVLGTQGAGGSGAALGATSASHDAVATRISGGGSRSLDGELPDHAASTDEEAARVAASATNRDGVRRQPSAAERALSGFASALGGGGPNSPAHAGLPRVPGSLT